MVVASTKANFTRTNSLFYYLPKKLVSERVFPVTILSIKKKHIDFRVDAFNLLESQTPFHFFSCLENHFSFYQTFLFEKQQFMLAFQMFDLASGTRFFSKKKKRINSRVGLLSILKEKYALFSSVKRDALIKARLLCLIKGGFVLSCFGYPAFLIKDHQFSGVQTQKTYKGWFSSNLSTYGHLSYFKVFHLEKLNKSYLRHLSKTLHTNRMKFYSMKNLLFGYGLLLGRPKRILF